MKRSLAGVCLAVGVGCTFVACNDSTGVGAASHSPNLGSLATGQVRVLTFDDVADGLTIPAQLASAQYLVVVSNVAGNTDVISSYTVEGDEQTSGGLSIPSRVGDLYGTIGGGAAASRALHDVGSFQSSFEARLRTYERSHLHLQDAQNLVSAQRRLNLQPGQAARDVIPFVGGPMTLKVIGPGASDNQCEDFKTTTGVVKAVGTHAIIVADTSTPSGGFSDSDYAAIAQEFDTLTYPTDVGYFGTPTDIDHNDGHIILYFTPSVNALTPPGYVAQGLGYVGGFFFAGDLFPTLGSFGCPASNEGEIFYLLAPDPNGVYGNAFQTDTIRQITRGTVAHEFQHMINAGHRFRSGASFESTWLDEAMAHFAEDAVGRAAIGRGDLETITLNDMMNLPAAQQQAFFLQNFLRLRSYIERPDTIGPIVGPDRAGVDLAARGASWAMLRYAADWFSKGNPRAMMQKMAAGPDTGVTNLTKATGVSLDTLLARWLVTLYTDHLNVPGIGGVYNYRSYELRALVGALRGSPSESSTYPLPVELLGFGTNTIVANVPSTSGAYFLVNEDSGGVRTIRVTEPSGAAAVDTNGRVYVVRVK